MSLSPLLWVLKPWLDCFRIHSSEPVSSPCPCLICGCIFQENIILTQLCWAVLWKNVGGWGKLSLSGVRSNMLRFRSRPTKKRRLSLCLRQTFVVRDVKAGSGIKERDYVLSRGLQKRKKSAHLWMKHQVPFLRVACTRLLARQGLPFVNEFPERQHYQGLITQCMCVYEITCTSTCL